MADEVKFHKKRFPKNSVLVNEGEQGEYAYLIVKGKVEIRKGFSRNNPQTLATRTRGDVVGELALFDNRPHIASVVAVEDTEVNAISREEFCSRLESMDPVMRGIMTLLVARVRQMTDELMNDEPDVNWAKWRG